MDIRLILIDRLKITICRRSCQALLSAPARPQSPKMSAQRCWAAGLPPVAEQSGRGRRFPALAAPGPCAPRPESAGAPHVPALRRYGLRAPDGFPRTRAIPEARVES